MCSRRATHEGSHQEAGQQERRAYGHEEEAGHQESRDVLEVVAVDTSRPLDMLVGLELLRARMAIGGAGSQVLRVQQAGVSLIMR